MRRSSRISALENNTRGVPMELTVEELKNLARRSRLALSDGELEKFRRDLEALEELSAALLPYADPVCDTDTPQGLCDMRADTVEPSLPREAVLSEVPVREGEYITVPCVVDAP